MYVELSKTQAKRRGQNEKHAKFKQ